MAAGVGLVLGVGLFMVWWSMWPSSTTERKTRPEGALQRTLRRAGIERVSTAGFVLSSVAAGLVVAAVIFILTASLPVGVCFFCFGAYLPTSLVRWRAKRRFSALRELWPDIVDNLRSAVRAGLSLPEALAHIGAKGPTEVRHLFEDFALDYRATGQFEPSMDRLKARLADATADKLIEALKMTRDVGGSDVGRLLTTLSAFLREETRTRNELLARQSWTVNAARLAVAAPWVVLLMLCTQPQAMAAFNSPAGWAVLLIGLAVSLTSYRIMVRIGALPSEPRVLQ